MGTWLFLVMVEETLSFMKRWLGNPLRNNGYWIVTVVAMLLGLTFFVSGLAKLPGQTEFADALLKSFWTPQLAHFISNIVPWIEACLGALLILGIFSRIAAILCLPLIIGFIANNTWALFNDVNEFSTCAHCFGVLEKYVGALSPLGALIVDIVLLCLALVVLVFGQKGFFKFQPWFINTTKKKGELYETTST
jgi:uncharacterized membrane protein YphA (DoxX/SURF4 family)